MSLNKIQVDVICMIDKSGKITPIKLRIENTDGSILVTKINEVVYCNENNFAGFSTLDYGCKVTIDGIEQLIELRYVVSEHKWIVTKLV